MENIYTILEAIEFEAYCKRAKRLIEAGRFMPDQFMFSVIQKFYEHVLEEDENTSSNSN